MRRHDLLELKAPQDGIVKDLATHTLGSVVAPGTVVMTLVPGGAGVLAEVWVRPSGRGNGGGRAACPIEVHRLCVPALWNARTAASGQNQPGRRGAGRAEKREERRYPGPAGLGLSRPDRMAESLSLQAQGKRHRLLPGMQVSAEIKLGTRTVMTYLLSPVQKTLQEAGREL